MRALRDGLNVVYKAEEKKNYFLKRVISSLYTLIIIVLIVALTFASVFGNQIVGVITKRFPGTKNIAIYILSLRGAFVFAAMFLILCFLYRVMPARRVKLRNQMGGALFASVFWAVMNNLFNLYISKVVMKSYTYGGLTMGIILMFWLYFGVTAILIGGQINNYLERTDMLRTIFRNDGSKPYMLTAEEIEEKNRSKHSKKRSKMDEETSETPKPDEETSDTSKPAGEAIDDNEAIKNK